MKATSPKSAVLGPTESAGRTLSSELRHYGDLLRKHLVLLVAIFILGVSVTALVTFSLPRVYRASATVIVDQQAPKVLGNEVSEVVNLSAGSFWRSKEYMETQKRVISSKTISKRVVERLQLTANEAFWGRPLEENRMPTVQDAAANVRRMLSAGYSPNSNILVVSISHGDPDLAATLANTVVDVYLEKNIEYKYASTQGAVKWLADQLDELKQQLETAELTLHKFRRKNNIISVSMENKRNLLAQRIETLNNELTKARVKRMEQASIKKEISLARNSRPEEIAVGAVIYNESIKRLKQRAMEEKSKLDALKERYLQGHPVLREQAATVKAATEDLHREVNNVLRTEESRYRQVTDRERRLAAALQEAKNEAFELNKREVAYGRLKREKENTAKLYGLVLNRMKESDLSAQLRVNNIRSLDEANVPQSPIWPRVKLNLLLGALLSLLLAIGLAFVVEATDVTVKTQEDIEDISGLVHLGMVPRIPGSDTPKRGKHRPSPNPALDLIVHRDPRSRIAEACRSIRTNFMFTSPDRQLRKVVITSPSPREGKTTMAVSMAITMAQSGSKVLLIDTDMRRPRLHKIFGVSNSQGITTALLGDRDPASVIKTTEVPNLFFLPCGPTPPNPAELCQSERFHGLLEHLGKGFERLLLDSPPMMLVTDPVVLSAMCDATILVARGGSTSRVALANCVKQIQDVSGHLAGCIVNGADYQDGRYGTYRYGKYGFYRYGYGYGQSGYGTYGSDEEGAATT